MNDYCEMGEACPLPFTAGLNRRAKITNHEAIWGNLLEASADVQCVRNSNGFDKGNQPGNTGIC